MTHRTTTPSYDEILDTQQALIYTQDNIPTQTGKETEGKEKALRCVMAPEFVVILLSLV
jgi:hypothetical protein